MPKKKKKHIKREIRMNFKENGNRQDLESKVVIREIITDKN
jgi:hypothetical protein